MKKILLALFLASIFVRAQKQCGFKDGLQEGNCIFYYENGQKKWDQNWKKGKLDGNYIAYFENGKEKAKGDYKKDKKIGEWVYYDENGKKTGIERYKGWKGNVYKEDGEIIFYKNEKVVSKGQFLNGENDGKWVFYKEDGTVDTTGIYKNGKLISTN